MEASQKQQPLRDLWSYGAVALMAGFYLASLSSSYISIKLVLDLMGGGLGTSLSLFGQSVSLSEAVGLLGTGIGEGVTMGDAIASRSEKKSKPAYRIARFGSFVAQGCLYYMALGQLFFSTADMTSLSASQTSNSTLKPPTTNHGVVVTTMSAAWAFGTNYVIPDALLLAISGIRGSKRNRKQGGLGQRLDSWLLKRRFDSKPHLKKESVQLPTIPRIELSQKASNWVLIGAVSLGIVGILSVRPDQPQRIRILRFSIVLCGAIAGGKLLYEFRTPSKLELEQKQLQEYRQQTEAELAEQRQQAHKATELEMSAAEQERTALAEQAQQLQQAIDVQQRQLELEKTELQQQREQMLSEQKEVDKRLQQWADEQKAAWEEQMSDRAALYEGSIATLQQQLSEMERRLALANAPKLDIGSKTHNQNCNRVIEYLWSREIVVDCYQESAWDFECEVYFLKPRSPEDFKKLKSDGMRDELEALLHGTQKGAVIVEQKGAIAKIAFKPGEDSRLAAVKKSEARQSQLYRVEQTVGLSLGYFLAGNSGSGKTAIASYIAHLLATKQPTRQEKNILLNVEGAEGIVLDVHNNRVWSEIGLTVVFKPLKILAALQRIRSEYEQRKGGKKGNRILIFVDEFEELLSEVELCFETSKEAKQASKFIADTVRMLGSGGRKFCLNILVMNQSWNTTAIKLDSNHRNNFIGIALNAACDNFVQQKCGASLFDNLRDWVLKERKDKYRAVTFGAVSPRALFHATHHDFQKVEDGQPPRNLKSINWLPLSLGLGEVKTTKTSNPVATHQQPVQQPKVEWLKRCYEKDYENEQPGSNPPATNGENPKKRAIRATGNQQPCPKCHSENVKKNGTRCGVQRWICKDCGKSF